MVIKYFLLLITLSSLQMIDTLGKTPVDHLIPPPAPVRVQKSIPQFIPLPGENPAAPFILNSSQESPGFMQRIVQWFGYGNGNTISTTERPRELPQQQTQASYYQPQYKELPNGFQYHRPKAPCNPCNKIPWLPMFQQPLLQGQRINNNIQILGPIPNIPPPQAQSLYQNPSSSIATNQYQLINQQLPHIPPNYDAQNFHVQRAVKFNYPNLNNQNLQYFTQQQLTPIPVPNLSATPIPPLFNAVPFHQNINEQQFTQQINYNQNKQNQPDQLHFEHLSQPSEIQTVVPTQIPANDIQDNQQTDHQNGYEVIQSIPVTDFIASIDHPVKVIQSEVIDLSKLQNIEQPQTFNQNIDQNLEKNKHNIGFPQLIELGSYEPQFTPHRHSQLNPHNSDLKADYLADPIIVHNHNIPDNLVAASSHNITIRHENHLDVGNYLANHQTLKPLLQEPFLPTILPPSSASFSSTFRPDYSTEHTQYTTIVDIQPSLQTASAASEFFKKDRDRGTPKRLLDAPILYSHNNINDNSLHISSPRPFTRDPSDLHIRSSTFEIPTIFGSNLSSSSSSTPWALSPTPTSTYSSLDASGQWAGISPPAQFQPIPTLFETSHATEKRPKQFHQIIIPYTTKNKPQPFKPRESQQSSTRPTINRYSGWLNSHEHQDYHEEQESKLITATQTTDGPTKKTTKYLTKILAANIRDLLKREHEVKNKSFGYDLNQLRKNIDDWTEQEFTSLSHKPSTVSIRGRSKIIPHEYLTTTPSLRQAKTTRFIDTTPDPTTGFSDDFQSLLLNNDFYSSQSIEDNNIEESKRLNKIEISTKVSKILYTPTARTATTTTTTKQPNTQPFYIRNIKLPTENEVWQKVKISISPLTKEKIYVVTPQPRLQIKTTPNSDDIGTFKSPRFIVRPTPASSSSSSGTTNHKTSTTTNKPKPKPYSPELFGLMGISAYIPAAPVDVLDGHSRVITVVTPTPHTRKRSIDKNDKEYSKDIKEKPLNDSKS